MGPRPSRILRQKQAATHYCPTSLPPAAFYYCLCVTISKKGIELSKRLYTTKVNSLPQSQKARFSSTSDAKKQTRPVVAQIFWGLHPYYSITHTKVIIVR